MARRPTTAGRRSMPPCSIELPRARLATLPTPLERGPLLPGGARLWVKRDDLTGLGDGRQQGTQARVPVRRGAGRRCALARHGRRGAVEPLPDDGRRRRRARARGPPRAVRRANRHAGRATSCSSSLFGAQLHFTGAGEHHWGELEIAREALTEELQRRRARPRSRSRSAGRPRSVRSGYVVAFDELLDQCRRHGFDAGGDRAHVVERRHPRRAASPGGRWRGPPGRQVPEVLAIGVAKGVNLGLPDIAGLGRRHARADRPGADAGRRRRRRASTRAGSARTTRCPTDAGDEAIRWAARHGGWVLDRTYTGKGFAGLLGNAAAGRWPAGDDVVFIHTGGVAGRCSPRGGAPLRVRTRHSSRDRRIAADARSSTSTCWRSSRATGERRRAVVDGVRRSLATGFVYTRHDLSEDLLDTAYAMLREFFALDARRSSSSSPRPAPTARPATPACWSRPRRRATSPTGRRCSTGRRRSRAGPSAEAQVPAGLSRPGAAGGRRARHHQGAVRSSTTRSPTCSGGSCASSPRASAATRRSSTRWCSDGPTLTRAIRYPPMGEVPATTGHVWAGRARRHQPDHRPAAGDGARACRSRSTTTGSTPSRPRAR